MKTDTEKTFYLIIIMLGVIVGVVLFANDAHNRLEDYREQFSFAVRESFDEGYQAGAEDALYGEDSCEMRFPDRNITRVNGVYQHPNYFCVWVRERSASEIARTTFHELAHYFSYHEPEHFCGTDYITRQVCKGGD